MALHSAPIWAHEEADVSPHSVIYGPIGSTTPCSKINQSTSRRPIKILPLFAFLVYIRQNPLSKEEGLTYGDSTLNRGGEQSLIKERENTK